MLLLAFTPRFSWIIISSCWNDTMIALLQHYFSVNEQYFPLTTNQHKPNFSKTDRAKNIVLSTKHTNQNKYPISYSTDQDDAQMQLRSEQSVSIFHVLPFHRRSYIASKLVSNCCPMVIDAKRKHTANTWFNCSVFSICVMWRKL